MIVRLEEKEEKSVRKPGNALLIKENINIGDDIMGCRESMQTFYCSKCKRTIRRKGKGRLSAIRRHYRDVHK